MADSREFLRPLKSHQDPAPDLVSVLQRCQSGSNPLPLVMSEVVVLNVGGQNQEVIPQIIIAQPDLPHLHIDANDLVQQHLHIALPEDGAQRPSNFVGREQTRRHLI
jgi:hypothetical protein